MANVLPLVALATMAAPDGLYTVPELREACSAVREKAPMQGAFCDYQVDSIEYELSRIDASLLAESIAAQRHAQQNIGEGDYLLSLLHWQETVGSDVQAEVGRRVLRLQEYVPSLQGVRGFEPRVEKFYQRIADERERIRSLPRR